MKIITIRIPEETSQDTVASDKLIADEIAKYPGHEIKSMNAVPGYRGTILYVLLENKLSDVFRDYPGVQPQPYVPYPPYSPYPVWPWTQPYPQPYGTTTDHVSSTVKNVTPPVFPMNEGQGTGGPANTVNTLTGAPVPVTNTESLPIVEDNVTSLFAKNSTNDWIPEASKLKTFNGAFGDNNGNFKKTQ